MTAVSNEQGAMSNEGLATVGRDCQRSLLSAHYSASKGGPHG